MPVAMPSNVLKHWVSAFWITSYISLSMKKGVVLGQDQSQRTRLQKPTQEDYHLLNEMGPRDYHKH